MSSVEKSRNSVAGENVRTSVKVQSEVESHPFTKTIRASVSDQCLDRMSRLGVSVI